MVRRPRSRRSRPPFSRQSAAMYFLLPPAGLAVGDASDQLSLGVFVATGLVISWLNHRLHLAEEAQRTAAATATARAERLDAILNTTVDGIIVIDAEGQDRGVQSRRRAAVRLSRIRSDRTQRQHADAVAASRGARRVSGALPDDRRRQDHRRRPRSHRPATRRHACFPCTCRSAKCGSAASASSPACCTT